MMRKFVPLMFVMCAAFVLGGCSSSNQGAMSMFVGPKTLPLWIGARQYYGVEKDYALSADEAEKLVKEAIEKTGGKYRYTTTVGTARTVYARTADECHVVIDIDPYRGYSNRVEIDINVGFVGMPSETEKLFAAINAQPLTGDVKSALDSEDSCDCK